jgi:TonB family protein
MKDNDRERHLAGHLGRGFVLSFLIHGSFVFPVIALAILLAKEPLETDIEMRFEEVSEAELPEDLPSLEPEVPSPADLPPRPQQPKTIASREAPPIEAKPEPEKPPEKEKEAPTAPKPQEKPGRMKMVDLDMNQEVDPPPDAKYLAQKNNRAREETRARDTNLERAQQGTEGSSPSDRKDEQVGDKDNKVARDEDVKSRKGKSAPEVTPRTDPRLPQQQSPSPSKSLLSMRDAPKRDHEVTPQTADPSLPRDPDGLRPMLDWRPEAVKDLPGRPGTNQSTRLALSGKQYEYLFGDDAEAARELAQKQRSRRQGRFSERMGRIQSALENFIPEVRPGNQTALNTRAAPFAAFIARMHRNILELWGFGFLEDLDRKPASSPMNNPQLITKLEIVLNADGTIAKVTIVKASGLVQFDVAAIDAVYSAGPYPDPPNAIRSANGKIYIHWTFHRDERQCATSGVDYYILDNPPAGGDVGEPGAGRGIPTPMPKSATAPKRLEREVAEDTPARRAKRRELDEAAGHGHGHAEPDHDANRRAAEQVVHADDPAARNAAAAWFHAYAQGDLRNMAGNAALPFRSSAGVAAKDEGELRALLSSLLEETPAPRKIRGLQLYSPAGVRGALGGLPPGFDDDSASLFAVAQVSGDTFVLVLGRRGSNWKAIGLVRR